MTGRRSGRALKPVLPTSNQLLCCRRGGRRSGKHVCGLFRTVRVRRGEADIFLYFAFCWRRDPLATPAFRLTSSSCASNTRPTSPPTKVTAMGLPRGQRSTSYTQGSPANQGGQKSDQPRERRGHRLNQRRQTRGTGTDTIEGPLLLLVCR